MTSIGFVRLFVRTPRLPHLEAFEIFSEQKHHETIVIYCNSKQPLKRTGFHGGS